MKQSHHACDTASPNFCFVLGGEGGGGGVVEAPKKTISLVCGNGSDL